MAEGHDDPQGGGRKGSRGRSPSAESSEGRDRPQPRPELVPQAAFDEMTNAADTIPFTVMAAFDYTRVAMAHYVSATKQVRMCFIYNSVSYSTLHDLGAAILADWRAARDTLTEYPQGVSDRTFRRSEWLLVRVGDRLMSLDAAKRAGVLAAGGTFVPGASVARATITSGASLGATGLQLPLSVHLRGADEIKAEVLAVRMTRRNTRNPTRRRPSLSGTCFYDSSGRHDARLQWSVRVGDDVLSLWGAVLRMERLACGDSGDEATDATPSSHPRTQADKLVVIDDLGMTLHEAVMRGAFTGCLPGPSQPD